MSNTLPAQEINSDSESFILKVLKENFFLFLWVVILLFLDLKVTSSVRVAGEIFIFLVAICSFSKYTQWLVYLVTLSSLCNPSLGIPIPGINIQALGAGAFLIFHLLRMRETMKARVHFVEKPLVRISYILFMILLYRSICTIRTFPENIPMESMGLIRNYLVFVCGYYAMQSKEYTDYPVEKKVFILVLMLMLVAIIQSVLFASNASAIDFKYNFEMHRDTVDYNAIRNSMGLGAAGVGKIAGSACIFCLMLLLLYPKGKFWSLCLLAGSVYCLLLSFTKTALLGCILSGVFVFLRYKKYKILFMFLCILGVLYLVIPSYFFTRIVQITEDTEMIKGGENSRWDMAMTPLKYMSEDDYIWGQGALGYTFHGGGYCRFRAHNGVMETLYEEGLIGWVLQLFFWGACWNAMAKIKFSRMNHISNLLSMFFLQFIVFGFIFFVNGGTFLYSGSGGMFFALLGIATALPKDASSSMRGTKKFRQWHDQAVCQAGINSAE